MKVRMTIALAALAFVSACGKSEEKAADAKADSAEPAAAAAGGTGVAECDDYVAKVEACVNDKVPEAQRAMFKQQLDAAKAQWAATPDKSALANACKMAAEQSKASYAAVGCTI